MFFDLFLASLPSPRQLLSSWKMEVRPNWTEHSGEERDGGSGGGDNVLVVADVADSRQEQVKGRSASPLRDKSIQLTLLRLMAPACEI